MNCPNCGRANEDGAKFCAGCGHQLTLQPAVEPAPEPRPSKGNKGRIVVFCVLGILLLAILAFVFIMVNKKPAPVDENTIMEDISSSYYMTDLNADIESIELLDRRTSAKDGYDSISAQVSSKNTYCGFLQTYDVYYRLYDNGWALESVMLDSTDYTLLQEEPDEEAVKADTLSLLSVAISEYQLVNLDVSVHNAGADEQTGGDVVASTSYDVTINAENSLATFTYSCALNYQFYPQSGWCYEGGSINSYSGSCNPKTFPTTEEATEEVSSRYSGDITYNDAVWNAGAFIYQMSFSVVDSSTYKYLTRTYAVDISYSFDPVQGWSFDGLNADLQNTTINATGKWRYVDDKNNYDFDIIAVNEEEVVFSCDLTVTDWLMALGDSTWDTSTNGSTVTREWSQTNDADYSLCTSKYVTYHEFGMANANYFYLEFMSFSGDRYDESGFYFNDKQLIYIRDEDVKREQAAQEADHANAPAQIPTEEIEAADLYVTPAEQDYFTEPRIATVTGDGLRLRAGPSETYPELLTMPRDTLVDAFAHKGNWFLIKYDDDGTARYGWSSGDYLAF